MAGRLTPEYARCDPIAACYRCSGDACSPGAARHTYDGRQCQERAVDVLLRCPGGEEGRHVQPIGDPGGMDGSEFAEELMLSGHCSSRSLCDSCSINARSAWFSGLVPVRSSHSSTG